MKSQELKIIEFFIILLFVGIIGGILYNYNLRISKQNQIQALNTYFQNLHTNIETYQYQYKYIILNFNPPVEQYEIKDINNTLYFYYSSLNYTYPIFPSDINLTIYIEKNGQDIKVNNSTFLLISNSGSNNSIYFIIYMNNKSDSSPNKNKYIINKKITEI